MKGKQSRPGFELVLPCPFPTTVTITTTNSSRVYVRMYTYLWGGARGVMVIAAGNGQGDTSSNPGRDLLHFT